MTATGISFSAVTNHSEPQADKNYINFGFLVDGASGEPRVCEPDFCSEWQWFPLDALPAPLFFGHEELIRIFLDRRPFSEESTF
jgi:ADP-ribose pyrophosphatase YjhB (NUDIX family)